MNTKLFNKNFSLIVLGQIISLFGNTILRFALSMAVLDITGSVAIFATILAISMIPTILLSAFGGILADRINKKKIMVALDFITFIVISLFAVYFHFSSSIMAIAIIMVILSIIQSFYQPAVQSSIPLLTSEDNLMKANGVVIQVNALASLMGPVIGGFIYGFFGLEPILYTSAFCFFASAVMELFIKVPNIKNKVFKNVFHMIKADFKEAIHFLSKEQRPMLNLLILVAAINLFLSAMIIVGLPYFIKIFLGLSNQLYGIVEGATGIGAIAGGLLAGIIAKKLKFKNSYVLLIGSSLAILPMVFALMSNKLVMVSYFIILISVILIMAFATLFTIYGQTIMQKLTPKHLLGKLSSVVTVITMCAIPLGQAIYGVLFGWAEGKSFIIVLSSAIICLVIAFISKKILKALDSEL